MKTYNLQLVKFLSFFDVIACTTFLVSTIMGIFVHVVLLLQNPVNERVLHSFSLGVGYDIMNGSILGLFIMFFPAFKDIQVKASFVLILSFFLGLFIDYHYVIQFGTHLPFSSLEYLINYESFDMSTVSHTLIRKEFFLLLFPLIVYPLILKKMKSNFKVDKWNKRAIQLINTFLFFILIGGISGAYSNSEFAKNFNDPLTSSGLNYFFVWSKDQQRLERIDKPKQALKVIHSYLSGKRNQGDSKYPLVRIHEKSSCQFPENLNEIGHQLCGLTRKPNILLILLESFRAVDIGVYGSEAPLTPQFDKWSKKGILFKNFFANGYQTRHGEIATYCSIIPNYGPPIMGRYSKNDFWCLPNQLKSIGYSLSWIHNSDAAFDSQDTFIPKIGFERLIDKYDFSSESEKLGWGYSDEALFDKWIAILKEEKQPFFSSALTITHHHPFEIPQDFKVDINHKNKLKHWDTMFYSDHQLGRFLEKVQSESWYQNSFIFITADTSNFLKPQNSPNNFEEFVRIRSQIPLLIVGGLVKHPQIVTNYASQIDLAPTIMDLLEVPYKAHWAGHSLINKNSPFIAFTNRPGNYWAVMHESSRYYNEHNKDQYFFGKEEKNEKKLKQLGKAWIETTKWLLQENLYWGAALRSKK